MYVLGSLSAIGAAVFFGFIGPTTKTAYNLGAGIALAIILRYIVASLLITPALIYNPPTLKIGSIFLTTGLLSAVNFIEVSLTMLIFATYPMIVLIFSIFINKEKILFRKKIFFFIAFIGIFFVLGPSFEKLNFPGIISAVTASLGASIMIISNQKMSDLKINPFHIHIFTNSFNSVFFILVIYLFFDLNINISSNAWILIFISTIFYTIAFILQLFAIQQIGQSRTALLLYIEPVVGILGATILLNEMLNQFQVLTVFHESY